MIYSPKHNYIFIHIPKTGGTSMALALENRAARDDIMLGNTPKAVKRRGRVKGITARGRLWKHSMLADLDGLVSQDAVARARVFTLVRNPWDRLVSYYHWLQRQNFDHDAVKIAKAYRFNGFLNHPKIITSIRANPYGRYVTGIDGQERCDLFLRLEHLAQDLRQLEDLIGLKLTPFPHENRSRSGREYQRYYSALDRQLVEDIAGVDIERFGYQFEA